MYESPLSSRYSSPEMQALFSKEVKYTTWRKLWVALAKAEKSAGLPITDEQINDLETHIDTIDFTQAACYEETYHHEVVAHIHAYGDDAPTAKKIIHLGATSSYVMDNGDLIQMKMASELLQTKMRACIELMKSLSAENASLPCLGWTHLQPAQPTTVGKRIALWLQDLYDDYTTLGALIQAFPFLGVKGATGTQASFLRLFDGDANKVEKVEKEVAEILGFTETFSLISQTYPRKFDCKILGLLASFAASCHKCGTDLRLLAHLGEMREGFSPHQVGSSAMPHKRNPILAERLCALSRHLITLSQNAYNTAATQWLERSLDDSANRRITLSEAYLCADALIILLHKIFSGIDIDKKEITANLEKHLPDLCKENLLMLAVKKGADRQVAHEVLRRGGDLKELEIAMTEEELKEALEPSRLIGLAPEQVKRALDHFTL